MSNLAKLRDAAVRLCKERGIAPTNEARVGFIKEIMDHIYNFGDRESLPEGAIRDIWDVMCGGGDE